MHEIRVGSLLVPGRTAWPELGEYNHYDGGHELRLFFARPTDREVKAVRDCTCEFALLPAGDVVFLLYRFGSAVPWSDAPFSWHLVPRGRRTVPASTTGQTRTVLQVYLVDAATGIVRVIRAVSLSPEFTARLHAAIAAQASVPWIGREAYDAQLAEHYRRWPTTEAMLADAVCRTTGGA